MFWLGNCPSHETQKVCTSKVSLLRDCVERSSFSLRKEIKKVACPKVLIDGSLWMSVISGQLGISCSSGERGNI